MNQFHFSALLDTFYMDPLWNTVDKMEILSKTFLSVQVQLETSMLNFADKFKTYFNYRNVYILNMSKDFFIIIYSTILVKYLLFSFILVLVM